MRILVIVESPSKVEKIKKILNSQDDGHQYIVAASCGHIMTLSTDNTYEKTLGVDIQNDYKPDFIPDPNKLNVITALKKQKNACQQVWIASDLDYEGEFIGWSICKCLGLSQTTTPRMIFNEITKDAILNAAKNPTILNFNAIDARVCRRVMDRLIGFKISSAARSINNKLRVGRVQTMMVKLVIDKEKEMDAHQKAFSFHTNGLFKPSNDSQLTKNNQIDGKLNTNFKSEEEMQEFLEACQSAKVFMISDKSERTLTQNPPAPLITSTLQSLVSRRLGITPKKVLDIAQSLYQKGVTSYPRTDCPRLPAEKMDSFGQYVLDKFGDKYHRRKEYGNDSKGGKKADSSAQEAHACIYPTEVTVEELTDNEEITWTGYEKNVYRLIWLYAVSSQMSPSETQNTRIRILLKDQTGTNGKNLRPKDYFTADHNLLTFEGYLKLWGKTAADLGEEDQSESSEDQNSGATNGQKNQAILGLKDGDLVDPLKILSKQKASAGPAPYTESSLIKKLSQHGIGRPSTYGQIMEVVMKEGFIYKGNKVGEKMSVKVLSWGNGKAVANEETEIKTTEEQVKMNAYRNRLFSTELGRAIDTFVSEYFPEIFNYSFTKELESEMDDIEKGQVDWYNVVDRLYKEFEPKLKQFRTQRKEGKVDMSNKRSLGEYQGKEVWVYLGRWGPVIQHGEGDDKRHVELDKELEIDKVTMDEIKPLLGFPRLLGHMEDGREIWFKKSRFGLYITTEEPGKNGKLTKINTMTPDLFTDHNEELPYLKQIDKLNIPAVKQLMEQLDEPKKVLRKIRDIEIVDGRYGPYFQFNTVNINIPKRFDLDTVTYEQCMELYQRKLSRNAAARKKALTKDGQPKKMLKLSVKKSNAGSSSSIGAKSGVKKPTISIKKAVKKSTLSIQAKP